MSVAAMPGLPSLACESAEKTVANVFSALVLRFDRFVIPGSAAGSCFAWIDMYRQGLGLREAARCW
jgi:hypothetical protein